MYHDLHSTAARTPNLRTEERFNLHRRQNNTRKCGKVKLKLDLIPRSYCLGGLRQWASKYILKPPSVP